MRDLEIKNPTLDGRPVAAERDLLRETQPWLRALDHSPTPEARTQLALDLAALNTAARADAHDVLAPTHVVELDGKVIGYASIGAIPMVNLWLNSKTSRPRDAMSLLNMVENEAARMRFNVICVPCGNISPFRKLMNRFGYNYLMESGFFTKVLRR